MQLLDNRLAGGQALHLDGERFGLHDRRHRHPDRLDRMRMLASRRDDEIPWDDVIANRIIVDHVYHRVDYEALWNTLERDIRKLTRVLVSWAQDRGVRLDLLSHTEWDLGDRGRASRGSRGTDRDVAFSGLEVVCESQASVCISGSFVGSGCPVPGKHLR